MQIYFHNYLANTRRAYQLLPFLHALHIKQNIFVVTVGTPSYYTCFYRPPYLLFFLLEIIYYIDNVDYYLLFESVATLYTKYKISDEVNTSVFITTFPLTIEFRVILIFKGNRPYTSKNTIANRRKIGL